MKTWSDLGFEVETTEDGSLSLRQLTSVDPEKYRGESMHHSGGAWSETLLIYGTPLREVLQKQADPSFLVVGLGLGYIELTLAREALLLGKTSSDIQRVTSYESVPELRTFFWDWLHQKTEGLHPDILKTYDQVAADVVSGTSLKIEELQKFLRPHFPTVDAIAEGLYPETKFSSYYHGIMYDAFSAKTTPHLWGEDFLRYLLSSASADYCLFSTYASRTALKRALADAGFEVITRPGFKGKRNSTLGIKSP